MKILLIALGLCAVLVAPARAGELLTVPADGAPAVRVAAGKALEFGTQCWDASGGLQTTVLRGYRSSRWSFTGTQRTAVAPFAGEPLTVSLSPGCAASAEVMHDGVVVRDAAGRVTMRFREAVEEARPRPVSWSADGRRVAFADTTRGGVRVVDVAARRVLAVRRDWHSEYDSGVLSPDGTQLAWGLDVLDVATGKVRRAGPRSVDLGSVVWSPDGRTLAGTTDEDGLGFVDLATGTFREIPAVRGGDLAWSPDGRWIAMRTDRGDGRDGFALVPAAGGPVRRVLGPGARSWLNPPVWSPDSRFVAVAR